MTINLNTSKLLKDMSIKDQARMMIADAHEWAKSKGQTSLIDRSDQQQIYQQARKKGYIRYLNQVTSSLKELQYIMINLEISFYHFSSMLVYFEAFIKMLYIKGTAEDVASKIIRDLLKNKLDKNSDDITEEEYKNIDEETDTLLKKDWFTDIVLSGVGYFDEHDIDHNLLNCKTQPIKLSPNKKLIETFNNVLNLLKVYQKFKKQVDLLIQRVDINLLSENQERQIKDYEELVNDFIDLKGLFSLLKIYIRLPIQPPDENQLAKTFIDTLANLKTKTQLTSDEIEECENEVEKIFNS